jgi:hypothetical protein
MTVRGIKPIERTDRDLVTREYHMRVIGALVDERDVYLEALQNIAATGTHAVEANRWRHWREQAQEALAITGKTR